MANERGTGSGFWVLGPGPPLHSTHLSLRKDDPFAGHGAHSIGHPGADQLGPKLLVIVVHAHLAGIVGLVGRVVVDRVQEGQGGIQWGHPRKTIKNKIIVLVICF